MGELRFAIKRFTCIFTSHIYVLIESFVMIKTGKGLQATVVSGPDTAVGRIA